MIAHRTRQRMLAILAALAIALTVVVAPGAAAASDAGHITTEPDRTATVRLWVPNRDLLTNIASQGFDLAGGLVAYGAGYEVDAVVTAAELAALRLLGIGVVEFLGAERLGYSGPYVTPTVDELDAEAAPPGLHGSAAIDADTVTIGRIDYFTTSGQGFISVEAKTDSSTAALTVRWDAGPGTEPGSGGSAAMSKFTDAGVYMYHRAQIPVDVRPEFVQVVSNAGGEAVGAAEQWLREIDPPTARAGYQFGFADKYMNPTEAYAKIEALAQEFPELAEIVPLPRPTNGYRRKAQAQLGTAAASVVVVTSKAWGHEGGNDLTIELVRPDEGEAPLNVAVDGDAITISLATNADGQITSRAIDVVNALNAEASDVVVASTYRGNAGNGLVAASGIVRFTDYLQAPEDISREPFTVRAIRIGKVRDGSKVGVLAFAQEHAREWVPVLVALETAERLLRNYETDPETKLLVDNLDIFIVPSSNPDGGHYSAFNYASQRRNMTNHCGPENSDPARRNAWGVDINRNYGVGTIWEGYDGASLSCISDTFAGPEPLSEPESSNIVWLAETNPNIKFSVSIHSHGGYLLWAPGVYKRAGREALPSPTLGQESFYWQMADHMLSNVKAHRGIAVIPQQTGAAIDVLYSAAGASDDHMWYDLGIWSFTFEVGTAIWNPTTRRFVSVGFEPAFSEGREEAIEYSNAVMALYEIAVAYSQKTSAEPTQLVLAADGTPIDDVHIATAPTAVRFTTSEPADIYYTTDGSRPTFTSSRYAMGAVREQGMELPVATTTTFKWFAVDMAGNIENGYDPAGDGDGYNEAQIVLATAPELTLTAPTDSLQTNSLVVTVTGTAIDPNGTVTVTVNGESAAVAMDGTFAHDYVIGRNGEGPYVLTVTATGEHGLQSSEDLTVHYDITPPVLMNVQPSTDIDVEQGEPLLIAFDSEPGLTATYLLNLPGQTQRTQLMASPGRPLTETAPGRYEATYVAPTDAVFSGAEIWFHATDQAGNVNFIKADGEVSVVPFVPRPEVTITSPLSGARMGSDVITVTGIATDVTGITAITVNGRRATVAPDGSFSGRVILGDGENVITVVVTAGTGKQATATTAVTAALSPPVLHDLEPATDVTLAAGETTVLRFKAAPGLTAKYQVTLGGTPGTTTGRGTPQGIAMTETEPGVYEATYTAPAGTSFSGALIRFQAADEFSNLTIMSAPGRITVRPTVIALWTWLRAS